MRNVDASLQLAPGGPALKLTADVSVVMPIPAPEEPPVRERGGSRRAPLPDPEPARTLKLFLLSSFRVVVDGVMLDARLGTKGRALLKILAAHRNQFLTKDALIEMLWPGTDPATSGVSLKVAAHSLRSVLEPDKKAGAPGRWILSRNGTYSLNPEAEIWIDVESLDECWRRGRALEAAGEIDAARTCYEQAEELYTGDFLEEDIYDDWTIIRREQLRDTYLEIVSRLAELAEQRGAHRDAITYAHKILAADPCREDAYQGLMRAHAALNQHARAGAWYAVCRTMLMREMSVQPARETVDLFESLFERSA